MLNSAYKLNLNDDIVILSTKINDLLADDVKEIVAEKFAAYKQEGVILSDFTDSVWILNDEKEKKSFSFEISELDFYSKKPSYKRETLIYILKAFAVIQLGSYHLSSLYFAMELIKQIIVATEYMKKPDILKSKKSDEKIVTLMVNAISKPLCANFFEYCSLPGMSEIADIFNDDTIELFYISKSKGKKRELAEFKSYFLFGKYLDIFWEHASRAEKLHFYPVFAYYHLSMLLPIRVSEFCVLPEHPVRKDYDGYHITVRRSNLKGGGRGIGYRLSKDYDCYEYAIIDDIAKIFLDYEELTKEDKKPNGCFWTVKYHSPMANRINEEEAKVYTKIYLNRLFDELYRIFVLRYKISVLTLEQYHESKRSGMVLNNNELVRIRAGDTRHIACIGLVVNGCNPMLLREFMGHARIYSAEHYYSNIKEYIDSYILMAYERMPKEYRYLRYGDDKRKMKFTYLGIKPEKVPGGWCYSGADEAE
ncbi:MAG: hypothetical protein IJO55_07305 [Lachnospiraceae bacterium]|nr:hypothetical protein [Lachnospiraceae bacterium]